jgi:hypothetical protein
VIRLYCIYSVLPHVHAYMDDRRVLGVDDITDTDTGHGAMRD